MTFSCDVHGIFMMIYSRKSITHKNKLVVSRGAVRSVASSYAAMRMVAGSRPVLVIAKHENDI